MTAYYNEIDPVAAQWLRNLIAAGHIAPGEVDERSIEDVTPADLMGFNQCHFFAGIGIWSYSLRRAGWSDDTPVWTGSCPCQPFSAAGKGGGFDDERHLWPAWHYLIEQRQPAVVFGEQVASKDGYSWLDLVQADLEGLGYACGAVVSPAAGYGAPHIRHRTYFMADSMHARRTERGSGAGSGSASGRSGFEQLADTENVRGREQFGDVQKAPGPCEREMARQRNGYAAGSDGSTVRLVNAVNAGLEGFAGDVNSRREPGRVGTGAAGSVAAAGAAGGMADPHGRDASTEWQQCCGQQRQQPSDSGSGELDYTPCNGRGTRRDNNGSHVGIIADTNGETDRPGPVNGFWRNADWLGCTDGRWRPVEPGTFPLAHGAPGRVGRLRAYGNGLCAEEALCFIEAGIDHRAEVYLMENFI